MSVGKGSRWRIYAIHVACSIGKLRKWVNSPNVAQSTEINMNVICYTVLFYIVWWQHNTIDEWFAGARVMTYFRFIPSMCTIFVCVCVLVLFEFYIFFVSAHDVDRMSHFRRNIRYALSAPKSNGQLWRGKHTNIENRAHDKKSNFFYIIVCAAVLYFPAGIASSVETASGFFPLPVGRFAMSLAKYVVRMVNSINYSTIYRTRTNTRHWQTV